MFPRTAYQEFAVLTYLKKIGDKNAGFSNRSGRGFPDIAAQSQNSRVIDQGAN
jgi:hypothetical protein